MSHQDPAAQEGAAIVEAAQASPPPPPARRPPPGLHACSGSRCSVCSSCQMPAACHSRAGVEVQWLATVVDSAATRRDGCTDKSSAPATHCSVQQAGYLAVAEILLAGCPEGGRAVGGLALLPLLQEAITSPICLPAGAGGCLGLAALWPRSAGKAHQPASAMRPGPACQRLLRQPPTKGCAVCTLALRSIAADVESTRSMAGLRWLLGRMPPDHLFDMSVGLLTPTQAALQARGCRCDLAFPCGHLSSCLSIVVVAYAAALCFARCSPAPQTTPRHPCQPGALASLPEAAGLRQPGGLWQPGARLGGP
jgi:hypothetical protein